MLVLKTKSIHLRNAGGTCVFVTQSCVCTFSVFKCMIVFFYCLLCLVSFFELCLCWVVMFRLVLPLKPLLWCLYKAVHWCGQGTSVAVFQTETVKLNKLLIPFIFLIFRKNWFSIYFFFFHDENCNIFIHSCFKVMVASSGWVIKV